MLKVHARKLGTVAVFSLHGRIVNGETEILRDAVRAASGVSSVILDLARVTAVDASGLGVMLELRQQVEANGIRFKLTNVTKWVSKLLQVTRLDSVFVIVGVESFPNAAQSRPAPRHALASCA